MVDAHTLLCAGRVLDGRFVLEEIGEKYEPKKVDLAGGEQRTEAYL